MASAPVALIPARSSRAKSIYIEVWARFDKVKLSLDDKVYEISEGEFLRFQANVPHDYACLSKKMATAIMQISYLP